MFLSGMNMDKDKDIQNLTESVFPSAVSEAFARILASPMPRGRGRLFYRRPVECLSKKTVGGKIHVLFVSYYPHISLIKKSMVLRRGGKFHTTFLGLCVREDLKLEGFFDAVYEAYDYREMIQLLLTCRVSAVHAMNQPFMLGLAAVMAKEVTGVRTLIDMNDFYYFIDHSRKSMTCLTEKILLEKADHVTHRMPREAMEIIRSDWAIRTPDSRQDPLPEKRFLAYVPPSAAQSTRLVFAGGVIPYDIAMARGHEGHVFDPLIRGVMDDGRCSLDFFVNQNARDMFWHEQAHYLDFETEFDRFRFNRGVPFHELPETLSSFGFGVCYENARLSSYNKDHFKYSVATKIFSYLEAGLPVLIPRHADTMNDFVTEAGIGVSYDADEPGDIVRQALSADYDLLKKQVLAFRESNTMEDHAEAVEALYR